MVDLSGYCSPVENQGALGSCSAHATLGIVEYYERRAFGKHIDGSRLFVYKTTRNFMGVTGDTGAWLRNAMGALVLCGVPDEKYWPYVIADFDNEPTQFVYSVADNFEAIRFFCHDPMAFPQPRPHVLVSVKQFIACGVPSMFGFWGYDSFNDGDAAGNIPLPDPAEPIRWGHAVVAIGYDDAKVIKNRITGKKTTGAFKFRNSWGPGFGVSGYGWMPYDYLLTGKALDFWSLLAMRYVDTDIFRP
jgi:C1A family cysteine protease